jgi:hypothetical protein
MLHEGMLKHIPHEFAEAKITLQGRKGRSKSILTIPERASTAATSLKGRLRANNGIESVPTRKRM